MKDATACPLHLRLALRGQVERYVRAHALQHREGRECTDALLAPPTLHQNGIVAPLGSPGDQKHRSLRCDLRVSSGNLTPQSTNDPRNEIQGHRLVKRKS